MPELKIPEEHRRTLVKLALLTGPQVESLVRSVGSLPPRKLKDFGAGTAIEGIDSQDVKGFFETLFSLHMVRAYWDVPVDEFLNDILESLVKHGESLTAENRKQLTEVLERLLGVKSLSVSAKAYSLQREHPYLFHDAKILCDLRPVFDSPSDPPVGLVIAYTLHIVFHKGAQHEDMFLALDAEDIQKLKTVIGRVEAKTSSLKLLLSEHKLNQII